MGRRYTTGRATGRRHLIRRWLVAHTERVESVAEASRCLPAGTLDKAAAIRAAHRACSIGASDVLARDAVALEAAVNRLALIQSQVLAEAFQCAAGAGLRARPPRPKQLQEVSNAHAPAVEVAGAGTAPLGEQQQKVGDPNEAVAGLGAVPGAIGAVEEQDPHRPAIVIPRRAHGEVTHAVTIEITKRRHRETEAVVPDAVEAAFGIADLLNDGPRKRPDPYAARMFDTPSGAPAASALKPPGYRGSNRTFVCRELTGGLP